MSKAKLTERQILIRLLLAGDSLGNRYTKKAYLFYRPLFLEYFKRQSNFKKPLSLYKNAFNILYSELSENRGASFGNGSLFNSLVFIGWSLAKKELKGTALPEEVIGYKYVDSDLLLTFLQQKEEYPLADNYVNAGFKEPAFYIYYDKRGYASYQSYINEDVYSKAYSKSMEKLLNHVENGRLKHPMSATVFTYFFNIFKNDMSDERKKKENNPIQDEDIKSIESESYEREESSSTIVDLFCSQFQQLSKYKFQDEKKLINHLLSKMSELCRKILTLHYLSGMSYGEIETLYGVKNAKSQASNCKKRLRNRLRNGD